ncbi:extracellular solute-binding protein [Actinomycetaceae bacterium TAE3-ERU4]|nr:extracellular solute-binding protein [Actinomycetaceae bacterium TAE3-ERU4]
MFRKKGLAVVIAASLAVSLGACGGTKSATPSQDDNEKVTLTYLSWWNEKIARPLIDAFEKENPNIKIDFNSAEGSANGYAQLLTTRIAGNQIPDIYHMSTEVRTDIMKGGYAKDLTGKPFMEGIDPTGAAMYSLNGKTYGMPVSAWAGVIVYNKDLLKKAGVPEKIPEKLPEFIEYGKKIKASGTAVYMEESNVVSGSFLPMLGGYFAQHSITDENNPIYKGEKTFSEVWTPVLTQWQTLSTSGIMPKEVVGLSGDQVKQEFLQGKLAMYRSGAWDFPDIKKAGINFGTAPYPAVEGGEPYIGGGPDSPFVMSSKLEGKKLQAAEKFFSFVNSDKGLSIMDESLGTISSSTKHKTKVDPEFEDVYVNYLQKGKYFWSNWPKKAAVMAKTMSDNFQELILGNTTPAKVTEALDAKWK